MSEGEESKCSLGDFCFELSIHYMIYYWWKWHSTFLAIVLFTVNGKIMGGGVNT